MSLLKKLLITLLLSIVALFGTIITYGTGSNSFSSDLNEETTRTLDKIITVVESKKNSLSEYSYKNMVLGIIKRLGYLYNEMVAIYPGDETIPTIDGSSIGLGTGESGNNNGGNTNLGKVIDMNAIPTDISVDANGWPKYLNIPSECPAPKEGKNYSFYFGLERAISGATTPANYPGFKPIGPLPLDSSTELQSGFTTVRNYFRQGGNWFQVPLTDDDIVAAPVYFPSVEVETRLLSAGLNSPIFPPQASSKLSISYCPGDFGDFNTSTQTGKDMTTPLGQVPLKSGCAGGARLNLIITNNNINSIHPAKCLVKPNLRYFINIANIDTKDINGKTQCEKSGDRARASSKKNGKQVCTRQFVVYGNRSFGTLAPPYTGPCLYKPPYPINYDAGTCLGARGYPHETSHLNCSNFSWLKNPITYDCQDSLGLKSPQKFTLECVNGKMDWTEGKGKPAWSSYKCEKSSELTYRDGGYELCNEEKEGQVYDIQCDNVSLSYKVNEGYKQCQFDTNTKSYRWVYTHIKMSGFGWTSNTRRCDAQKTTATIANDECGFGGETYPIGTIQNIKCVPRPNTIISPSLIEMKKECKRTGTVKGQPAIPSFVSKQGYEMYSMFLLNKNNFMSEGASASKGFVLKQGFGNTNNSYNCNFTYDTP